jgi:hypothetical protein
MSTIVCPLCLTSLNWAQAPLMTLDDDGNYVPVVGASTDSVARARLRTDTAYRTCNGTSPAHYLPASYGDEDVTRISVAMIANTAAGKSHLLAAMIGQFVSSVRLRQVALQVSPLDLHLHRSYMDRTVTPFLDQRKVLDHTSIAAKDITDGFLVTNLDTGKRFAITFFDVSGELLARPGADEKVFLGAVNALMFVVDPQSVRGLAAKDAGPEAAPVGRFAGDPAFDVTLKLLRVARSEQSTEFLGIPAAVIVAKSDLLRRGNRFVNRWMRADTVDDLDLSTVEEESGDVFTFLYTNGAERWLEPALQCTRSTLHFVSAAGTAPRDGQFPEASFQPRRVIKPLLALLAMKGVIDPALLEEFPR